MAELQARCLVTPRPWRAQEFADFLTLDGVHCAECPAGFALGRTCGDEAELLTIVIAPEARRTGWGRRLLAGFEAQAISRGATTGFLEVAADNDAACALYHASGFQQCGCRKGYYRRPDGSRLDALVMRKVLGANTDSTVTVAIR